MGRAVRSGVEGALPRQEDTGWHPWPAPTGRQPKPHCPASQPDGVCRTANVPGGRVTRAREPGGTRLAEDTRQTSPSLQTEAAGCNLLPSGEGLRPQAMAPLRSPRSSPPSRPPGGASRGRPRGSQWSSSQLRPCPLLGTWPPAQRARVVCPARKASMTRT